LLQISAGDAEEAEWQCQCEVLAWSLRMTKDGWRVAVDLETEESSIGERLERLGGLRR